MPMEQWPGPGRDEDDTAAWEAPDDEPGDYLPGADFTPGERFPGEMEMGPEYWMLRDQAEEDEE
jgi:hypothetical protein